MLGFFLVFLGSGLGGMLRHGAGVISLAWLGEGFPYGTLFVNVIGSALLGAVIGFFAFSQIGGPFSQQDLRLFLTTGVMGGFTTFSTFSLDTVTLWERGQHIGAVLYVLISVIVSISALFAAMWLARR